MQLNYSSSETDHNYFGRIFLFAKKNLWLFVLDLLIIVFLALPPYSWQETQLIIVLVVLLLIRDAFILVKGINHLGKFVARGKNVEIGILKGSSIKKEFEEYLRKGWIAFTLTSDEKKILVYKLDPNFEKVILTPIIEGV